MAHDLALEHVNEQNVHFVCSKCGGQIGFNKPGVGEPCAILNGDGSWSPPENPDQWMSPCPE